MDADVVIKMTKSSLKETVVSSFTVLIPPEVAIECVEQGKAGGHPDAFTVAENIDRGRIRVHRPRRSEPVETAARDLGLKGGEAGIVRLMRSGTGDVAVSDDRRFIQVLAALGLPHATSSSLLVALAKQARMSREEASRCLEKLKEHISEAQYAAAKAALEEAG